MKSRPTAAYLGISNKGNSIFNNHKQTEPMKLFKTIAATAAVLAGTLFTSVSAQDTSSLSLGADIYSRYVFRGSQLGPGPSIQPGLLYEHKTGLFAGIWGAYQWEDEASNEIDLYLGYSHSSGLKVTVCDYTLPEADKYFNMSDTAGVHTMEGILSFDTDEFPLTGTLGYTFHGSDPEGDAGDYKGSLYAELGYKFLGCKKLDALSVFVGAGNKYYAGLDEDGEYRGFYPCNIGLKGAKTITVTESFSIPVTGQFIVNPATEKAHFVVGFTF